MAKAAALTEGSVKTSIKTTTTAKTPAPPPAPTKKAVSTKAVVAKPEPVKPTKAKKPTTVVTSLFEEVPPPKKTTKKVEPKAPVVVLPVKPEKTTLAKKDAVLDVKSMKAKKIVPVADEDISAADAGVVALSDRTTAKKVLTKEEIAIEMWWAKVFNAYLKRDLKQASAAVAALTVK